MAQPALKHHKGLWLALVAAAARSKSPEEVAELWQEARRAVAKRNAPSSLSSAQPSTSFRSAQASLPGDGSTARATSSSSPPPVASLAALCCAHLLWKHGRAASFTVDSARQDYLEALEAIANCHTATSSLSTAGRASKASAARRNEGSSPALAAEAAAKDSAVVDLVRAMAELEMGAGHVERGVALLQALLDFHLCVPPDLWVQRREQQSSLGASDNVARERSSTIATNTSSSSSSGGNGSGHWVLPLEARVALFEAYWDAEAPRFGENPHRPSRCGWAAWDSKPAAQGGGGGAAAKAVANAAAQASRSLAGRGQGQGRGQGGSGKSSPSRRSTARSSS